MSGGIMSVSQIFIVPAAAVLRNRKDSLAHIQ